MEVLVYPILVRNDPGSSGSIWEVIERSRLAGSGDFLVGTNKRWHGGVHFKSKTDDGKNRPAYVKGEAEPAQTRPETFNEAVQSVGRGKIVAYRLNSDWLELESVDSSSKRGADGNPQTRLIKYSTSFVLVHHDLSSPYVKADYRDTDDKQLFDETLYKDYSFYSLYMHLAPLNSLKKPEALLPWFLSTKRKTFEAPFARLEPVMLVDPLSGQEVKEIDKASRNGLVRIKPLSAAPVWVERSSIARVKGQDQFCAACPIDHYYEAAAPELDQIHGDVVLDKVVALSGDQAIPVGAGDIIGFPGGTIIAGEHVGGMFHFEIFAGDTDFLKNKPWSNDPEAAHANQTRRYYWREFKKKNDVGLFAAGQFYRRYDDETMKEMSDKEAAARKAEIEALERRRAEERQGRPVPTAREPVVSENLEDPKDAEKKRWLSVDHIVTDFDKKTGTFAHRITRTGTIVENIDNASGPAKYLDVYSDADWLEGPEPWRMEKADAYFNSDGLCNRVVRSEMTERGVFQYHSEWSDKDLDRRYALLKNTISDYEGFIEHVKNHCFWSQVGGLPASEAVRHFNPIDFVRQLRRILTIFFQSDSVALRHSLERQTNETIALLTRREKELEAWLVSGAYAGAAFPEKAPQRLREEFTKWFGAFDGAPIKASEQRFQLESRDLYQRATPITEVPDIKTTAQAVKWIHGIVKRNLELLKRYSCDQYAHCYAAPLGEVGAYVYARDDNHNIHLGSGMKRSTEASIYAVGAENDSGLKIIAHECSHFQDIGMMEGKGGNRTKHGLYDVFLVVKKTNGRMNSEYSPYGADDCKRRAELHPVSALCNADNYARFVTYDVGDISQEGYDYHF